MRRWWPRMWLFLSLANVWSSGVAAAHHDWLALGLAAFFGACSWWMSGVRLTYEARP